jgi:hypothetical protein
VGFAGDQIRPGKRRSDVEVVAEMGGVGYAGRYSGYLFAGHFSKRG